MTNEEIQALKEELKQEIIAEMKEKRTERVDEAYLFSKAVTEYCQSLDCSNIEKHDVKNFIYAGVKINLNIRRIANLTISNIEQAYEIFEQLKQIIDTRRKLTKVIVTGSLDCTA